MNYSREYKFKKTHLNSPVALCLHWRASVSLYLHWLNEIH